MGLGKKRIVGRGNHEARDACTKRVSRRLLPAPLRDRPTTGSPGRGLVGKLLRVLNGDTSEAIFVGAAIGMWIHDRI